MGSTVADARALFQPLQLGDVTLSHRLALAPCTRLRNDEKHVVHDIVAEYYSQRGSTPGTLLIAEATAIAPRAVAYTNAPGIWSPAQIAGWKKVVEAVHAKGSFIFLQLWATGRAATVEALAAEPDGPFDVVSASNIPFEGGATPRPLTVEEIKEYPVLFAQAAKNFVDLAGGDGVEIHGANGYLLDQFLQTCSNDRTDNYGGSVENRARFHLEVTDAVAAAVGANKVGMRLSPYTDVQGMKFKTQAEIVETFGYLTKELKRRQPDLAYLHVVEPRANGVSDDITPTEGESLQFLYELWTPKTFVVAGGYKAQDAIESAEKWNNTIIAEGRHFISTPDLVERVRHGVALNKYNRPTFYTIGSDPTEGYTDYPFASELAGSALLTAAA